MAAGGATPAGAAGAGTPMGMGGMPGGMGTPGGGNMFARTARTGARSRYVDTLNPNATDPSLVCCMLVLALSASPVLLPACCGCCSRSACKTHVSVRVCLAWAVVLSPEPPTTPTLICGAVRQEERRRECPHRALVAWGPLPPQNPSRSTRYLFRRHKIAAQALVQHNSRSSLL